MDADFESIWRYLQTQSRFLSLALDTENLSSLTRSYGDITGLSTSKVQDSVKGSSNVWTGCTTLEYIN